jgi:hypothetical protein
MRISVRVRAFAHDAAVPRARIKQADAAPCNCGSLSAKYLCDVYSKNCKYCSGVKAVRREGDADADCVTDDMVCSSSGCCCCCCCCDSVALCVVLFVDDDDAASEVVVALLLAPEPTTTSIESLRFLDNSHVTAGRITRAYFSNALGSIMW